MSDDNDKTVDNSVTDDNVNVDDNVNKDDVNNDVIEDEDKTQKDGKKGILDTIKNIIKRTPDKGGDDTDGDDETNSDSSNGSDSKVTDDDIPEQFIEVATAANWSEQQIIDHAKKFSNAELLSQIDFLQNQDSDSEDGSDKSDSKADDSGESKKKSGESDDTKADDKDAYTKKLEERIAKLEKDSAEKNDSDSKKELVAMAVRASTVMDEVSEQYDGVFGKHDELPRFPDGTVIPNSPENIARNQVWELTRTLAGTGMDFESALSTSLNAYKGENLGKTAERNVVKQLRRSAKKVSPKRHSTTATSKAKTGPEVVREVLKKHGRG